MSEIRVGVVGTGSMGSHHARIYAQHRDVNFVGVHDTDTERARDVADTYETRVLPLKDLLDRVDAVSVAVPTEHHYKVASAALDIGVDVLLEKPMVDEPAQGESLVALAHERDAVLQVGHVERFNPAVQCVLDIVDDLSVIAVEARRLGPPIDRGLSDSAALDLMIHDVDVAMALLDEDVRRVAATGTEGGAYTTATVTFDGGVVGQFTASRVTQQKIRSLSITAEECRVNVDYADQTVHIHRRSIPEYVDRDGDVRFRHESLVERPTVDNGEPLQREIDAFLTAVRDGTDPVVSGEQGLRALRIVRRIDALASDGDEPTVASPQSSTGTTLQSPTDSHNGD